MRINDCFCLRKICNVYLLVPIMANQVCNDVIELNQTAGSILEECDKYQTPEELVSAIAKQYVNIEYQTVYCELMEYVKTLIENSFVVI